LGVSICDYNPPIRHPAFSLAFTYNLLAEL
jgi:hypothetical protein